MKHDYSITKIFTPAILIFFYCSTLFSQSSNEVGAWSDIIPFEIVPVAVANLPDGKLMTWSSKYRYGFGGRDGFTYYEIFDPFSGENGEPMGLQQTTTNHDMFCPGINNLPDGRLLVAGGSSDPKTTIYDYRTDSWLPAENMNVGRGYQGNVTLSDGSAFTIGGSWSGGRGGKVAELWTPEGGWKTLPGIPGDVTFNADDAALEPEGIYRLDNHVWLWPAPNGKIFHAGPGEEMHWLDVSGSGSFEFAGNRADDTYSMKGTTVMFDVGKILKVGGATNYASRAPAKDNSYVIDINNENNVQVLPTSNNLSLSRTMHNSTVLPNGEVLVTGGLSTAVAFSDQGARLTAEIYNPDSNSWRTVAGMQVPRTYHSVAILQTDGRVFVGGGGLCFDCTVNHPDAEIYSPPYLFDTAGNLAVRPTLNAPETAAFNSTISATGSENINDFVFIRMSSATHSTNNEQRRIPTSFTRNGDQYRIAVPGANLLPPGYYMLFAMNAAGVPSLAEVVNINEGSNGISNEDSLLVNFEFNETSGATIFDSSGNNNNGEIIEVNDDGTTTALSMDYRNESGFDGISLQMDGFEAQSNSLVNIESSTSLRSLTDKITVMAWVNRNTGSIVPGTNRPPNVSILTHDYPSFFFGYHDSQYKLEFFTDTGDQASCYIPEYNPGEWEHLAGTYDGNTAKLYVNGQEICSRNLTGNLIIDPSPGRNGAFTVGGLFWPNYVSGLADELDGSIDKFKLFSSALTFDEIQAIYRSERDLQDLASPSGTNLALNKPTLQSSTAFEGASSRAVDGNLSGDYNGQNSVTHTGLDTDPWWRVDLGDVYTVSNIQISNRTDCCPGRLQGAKLYLGNSESNNPNDFTEVATLTGSGDLQNFNNLDISGRYVMVRHVRQEFLSLAEVQVFGELSTDTTTDNNLALNKPTVQSSTAFEGASSRAVDGNLSGDYNGQNSVTHTGFDTNPWWRVDLGNVYTVSNIQISNRTDCCPGRLQGAKLYIGNSESNNPNDFTEVATLTGSADLQNFNNLDISGRYVMVRHVRQEFLSLAEVQVFGELSTDTTTDNNLALNKSAQQSTSSSVWPGAAALAVDGNALGNYYTQNSVTHTDREANPWWRVDLGDTYDISDIEVFNRTDCCSARLQGAQVFVGNIAGNNPTDFVEVATLSGSTNVQNFNGISVRGRYVLIRHVRSEILSLAEVRVFGALATGTTNLKAFVARNEIEENTNVSVYPNPTSGELFVNFTEKSENETVSLVVSDANGRTLFEKDYGFDYGIIERINLDFLPNGIYFLQIMKGTERQVESIVISK